MLSGEPVAADAEAVGALAGVQALHVVARANLAAFSSVAVDTGAGPSIGVAGASVLADDIRAWAELAAASGKSKRTAAHPTQAHAAVQARARADLTAAAGES